MQRPWMPFYVTDYLTDTGHLSTVQHGAYILLLVYYWTHGGLPSDERQLANITRLNARQWHRHRATLQAFFYDGWKHKRVERELQKMIATSIKRAAAGSKGGTVASIHRFRRK